MLLLGGSTEASALARALAEHGIDAVFSYAGRVEQPRAQPLPTRNGGFGGVDGLVAYLRAQRISHLIDATHPFAAGMSRNAHAAAVRTGTPLLALSRPAWQAQAGDRWQEVADFPAAVAALAGPAQRVLLALGRLQAALFADQPQHHYLLRLIDPPAEPLLLPNHALLLARGPFSFDDEIALLRSQRIERIVCKNAGGDATRAKLDAARALGVPVLMIARPQLPARPEVHTVSAALQWLGTDSTPTLRGV